MMYDKSKKSGKMHMGNKKLTKGGYDMMKKGGIKKK